MRKVIGQLFALSAFFLACKKDNNSINHKQSQIIRELGFNNFILQETSNTPAISFATMAEAREYLRPYRETNTIHTTLKKDYKLKPHVTFEYLINYIKNRVSLEQVMSDDGSYNGEGAGPSYPDNGEWVDPYDHEALDPEGNPCNYGHPVFKKWAGWAGHKATFSYTKGIDNTYTGANFNSDLMGLVPGVSWDHESGSSTSTLDANGELTITIHGTQNYNIIVEELGTLFKQACTITIKFNPCANSYSMKVENS